MPLHWGILGVGDIVHKRVAQAILDDSNSRLVAACRRNEAKLRGFCQSHFIDKAYTRDLDLINDPAVQAVYISTPVNLHLPQTIAAARAGKHVLVEKPMARSVEECDQMVEACRQANVRLGVAYYRRFYPIVCRMKEIVGSGELGRILSVSAVTSTLFPFQPGDDGYWRVVPAEGGGGALMDIGSHRINLFLDLFGDVAGVKASCPTIAGNHEAEDCATLLLRFASGVHGVLQCYFGTAAALDEFTILGSKGMLSANPLNGSELVVQIGTERRVESHPPPANLHGPLVADFAQAVIDGLPPRVSGEEGKRANEVMESAYRDAGRWWFE